jgi:hypothetical protein
VLDRSQSPLSEREQFLLEQDRYDRIMEKYNKIFDVQMKQAILEFDNNLLKTDTYIDNEDYDH